MLKCTFLNCLRKGKEINMGQEKDSTISSKGKHLKKEDRIKIEVLLKSNTQIKEIAKILDRSPRTIQREKNRGKVEHMNSDLTRSYVYRSDRGQEVYDLNATAKGPQLKLGKHRDAAEYIREQIVERRCSPEVVAYGMKEKQMGCAVSTKTIYSYIEQGLIVGVTNESLWEKRKRKKRHKRTVFRRLKKCPTRRKGIEERPKEVSERVEFGHWEIDLIIGKKSKGKPVLLTLTERKTRNMIIQKLSDKSQDSTIKAMDKLERVMGTTVFQKVFKSITADNGSEFLDVDALERSVSGKSKRTAFYYAHPYASWERGSNENGNRMIRRFISKGNDIAKFTHEFIKQMQDWINNYPRKILGFKTAKEQFILEMAS